MGLVDLVDRVGELAATPVFFTMDCTGAVFDNSAIAFNHRRNLLALIRMHQKNDFVVSHYCSCGFCPHSLVMLDKEWMFLLQQTANYNIG